MAEENITENRENKFENRNDNKFKDLKRNTAYRLFIGMIFVGEPEFHNEKLLHVNVNKNRVVRINIIANVVEKFISDQNNYCALTIDDGTGSIRVKAFSDNINLIKSFNQGDTLNIIGTLKFYNDEVYIFPEIAKPTTINWLIARKLELEKDYGRDILTKLEQAREQQEQEEQAQEAQENQTEPLQAPVQEENFETEKIQNTNENKENKIELTLKEEILAQIKGAEPQGLDIDKLIMSLSKPVDDINTIISDLLESAEIYEPKPGRLRIL